MNRRLAQIREQQSAIANEIETILTGISEDERDITDDEKGTIESLESRLEKLEQLAKTEERLASKINFSDSVKGSNQPVSSATKQFSSLGEFLKTVQMASHSHGKFDQRLIEVGAGTGMNESDPSQGGFLVQSDFASDLLKNAFDYGILSNKVRRRQISARSNRLTGFRIKESSRVNGSRHGGIRVFWLDEGALKSASQFELEKYELLLNKLAALFYVTDELLEDTVALQQQAEDSFRDEFSFTIDDAILWGTGAGMPLGIMNSPALITITPESGQTSGINLTNVLKMYERLWSRSKARGTAAWYGGAGVMRQLMTMTLGGTASVFGSPVFLPAGGVSGKPYATLLGLPFIEIEHAAEPNTTGDFGLFDLNEYLLIEKGGIKSASSIHVRFIYDETCFRWVYRCGGGPLWRAPLTPYKGSDTTSPFVVLGTRAGG